MFVLQSAQRKGMKLVVDLTLFAPHERPNGTDHFGPALVGPDVESSMTGLAASGIGIEENWIPHQFQGYVRGSIQTNHILLRFDLIHAFPESMLFFAFVLRL